MKPLHPETLIIMIFFLPLICGNVMENEGGVVVKGNPRIRETQVRNPTHAMAVCWVTVAQ